MTEFEIATLGNSDAALWVAIAQVLIGAGQLAAICWGIRLMHKMSTDRKLDAEARDRQTEARDRQTAEYAKEARERHHEAMRQGREHHEHAMQQDRDRHEEAMAALTALIHRTSAPGTA